MKLSINKWYLAALGALIVIAVIVSTPAFSDWISSLW